LIWGKTPGSKVEEKRAVEGKRTGLGSDSQYPSQLQKVNDGDPEGNWGDVRGGKKVGGVRKL